MAFAEIALGQIRALRQSASPRNYEIWYTCATGQKPSLNQMINEILARNGSLTDKDVSQIYDSYIASTRVTDRIDRVGNQFKDEIDQVMAMIDAAAGTTSSYSESLADVSHKLGHTVDRDGLRTIVESLVQTTKEMEQSNQALEASLSASKQEICQLQEYLEALRTASVTDPLTLLANRKHFDIMIQKTASEAVAKSEPLSLIMTDIDHLKNFNDSYGHLTGDQVLRLVAMTLKQNIKGQDIVARYGGGEFAVVLPRTPLRAALTVANHFRRALMTKALMKRSTGEYLGRVTISLGVAALRPNESARYLIERADACLYAAKRSGRNRVVCESDPEVANADTIEAA